MLYGSFAYMDTSIYDEYKTKGTTYHTAMVNFLLV